MHSLQAYAFGFHLLTTTHKNNIKRVSCHRCIYFEKPHHTEFNETGNLHGNDGNVNGKYER